MEMQSWMLVMALFYQTPSVTTAPGLYQTRSACEAARVAYEQNNQKTDVNGVVLEAWCIPGPVIVLAPPVRK